MPENSHEPTAGVYQQYLDLQKTIEAWRNMCGRCYDDKNDSYEFYGAKGIRVCPRWLDPEFGLINFINDVGRPPSGYVLGRKNPDLDYTPDNTIWMDSRKNRRQRKDIVWIEYNKVCRPLIEVCEEKNLNPSSVHSRLRGGMSGQDAIDTPGIDSTFQDYLANIEKKRAKYLASREQINKRRRQKYKERRQKN